MRTLALIALAALSSAAFAEGATAEHYDAFADECETVVINPFVSVERCYWLDGVEQHVYTPSGNDIHILNGDWGFIDYDLDSGDAVASFESGGHINSLQKTDEDGETWWQVNHQDTCYTFDTPRGTVTVDTYLMVANGEVITRSVERGGECD